MRELATAGAGLQLHPRCHVVDFAGGLLVRAGEASRTVREPDRVALARRVLALVDGRPASAILAGVDRCEKVATLRLLGELTAAGIIDDGSAQPGPLLRRAPSPRFADGRAPRRLVVVGDGATAEETARALTAAGAPRVIRHATGELDGGDAWVIVPDGPELALVEAANERARRGGVACVFALMLDDHAIAGVLGRGDDSGCFRCFELRWLGMAEDVGAENAFFEHLRRGGWRRERAHAEAHATVVAGAAVRALVESLSSAGPVPRVSFMSLTRDEVRDAPLLPHPACELCAPPPRRRDPMAAPPLDRAPLPEPALLGELTALADARIGIVGKLAVRTLPSGAASAPLLTRANARFAIVDADPRAGVSNAWSQACAADADTARLVALAEALERYCGIRPAPDAPIRARRDELGERAVCPTTLPLFSERQYALAGFPFAPYSPARTLSWREGFSLTGRTPRLVPECAVSYGTRGGELFDECSSGMAAHGSPAQATLRALLELIERDAFMIAWLHRLSLPLIDLDEAGDPYCRAALDEIRAHGYDAFLVDLTTDLGVPTTLALMIGSGQAGPALVCGAAADLDAHLATRRALLEAHGAFRESLASAWKPGRVYGEDEVRSLEDHGLAYAHPAWLPRARFLWSGRRRRRLPAAAATPPAPAAQLAELVARLDGRGLEVIVVDMTAPELASTSLSVVRVLVPGLQPIGFGTHGIRLGGRRLYEAPVRMGERAAPPREDELNPTPHCFP